MEEGLAMRDTIMDNYLNKHAYGFYPNKFPYDCEKNLNHDVLWFHPEFEFNKDIINKIINFHLDSKNKKYFTFKIKLKTNQCVLYHIFMS